MQGGVLRDGGEHTGVAHLVEVFIVVDAVKAFAVRHEVLMDEDLVRSLEGGRHDEVAVLVVE
jgi:hypothetical protein